MWEKIKKKLAAPKFENEPDKDWFAGLVNTFVLITIVFSFLLFVAHLLSRLESNNLRSLIVVVFVLSLVALYVIHRGKIYLAAIGLLILGFGIVTSALVIVGTVISAVTIIYVFVIVIASLLFGKKGLAISVTASSIAVLVLIFLEVNHYIQATNNPPGYAHWITFTTVFGLVGMVILYASEKLQQSEYRYRTIAELASDYSFVYQVNSDGTIEIEWAAGPLEKLTGYTKAELMKMGGWAKIIHKDDLQIPFNQFKTLLQNRADVVEYRIIHKDKSLVWVRDSARPVWSEKKKRVVKIEGAIKNISESKKLLEFLRVAKEKAEESDRLKSSFLANMSHEIRTPLNGILGFAELLTEPDLDEQERKQFTDIIRKSGQNMLHTINDIIDISKVEAGLMDINIVEHHVNDVLNELYDFFKPEVKKRGLKLSIGNTASQHADTIQADRHKLIEVLTNLIKNAIKYTNKGEIEFGYRLKNDLLEFYVHDTGRGIPKDKIDSVFQRFIQAGNDMVHVVEGSGLGLSIARAYVEMHHGKIWVESEEGVGSTFYFSLPRYQH